MKKYELYKDSGIQWIGEIPSHWNTKKVKYLTKLKGGYAFKSEAFNSHGIPVIRIGDISEIISWGDCKKIDDENIPNEFRLNQFDTLIALSGATTGKTCFIQEVPPKAYINQRVARIEFRNKLLFYIINSRFFQEQIILTASGSAQENISNFQIENLEIAIPSDFNEQSAIAAYLDGKAFAIDQLIADKKRLLELYEEEKATIINHAVTKGLDANARMEDSDIEWLGEIPEHWELKRLKYLVTKIGSGVTPSGGASVYELSGIPLLRSQNIHFDGLRLEDVAYISELIDAEMSNSRIKENDVLLNITGASIGRCFYVPVGFEKGNVNQHVCIIRPITDNVLTKYLYFLLRSNTGQLQIKLQQTGANREGLNFEQLKNFVFPIPGMDEQISIINYIETQCFNIALKWEKTIRLIDLLTEYCTALINEVVTGKVKVID